MASFRKRGDAWYFKFIGPDGKPRERRGCPDRKATEQMARAAETDAARIKAGLVDPNEARRAHEAKRPIGDHVDDYAAFLVGKGSSVKHIASTRTYIRRIIDATGAERIGDLSPSAVSRVFAALKDRGLSARAVNAHVIAIKGFSKWLRVDGRTVEHALESLSKRNEKADQRHRRRALSPDEARRLIQAAEHGPTRSGLTGNARAALYSVALATGFRVGELRSLTPERFTLDADPPTITILAGYAKNGRESAQPIPTALAERLRSWLKGKTPGSPVFALPDKPARMLRGDLVAAGIEPENSTGVLDFHALRTSFISHVVAGGASVKVAQTLARHSTATLTFDVYARASLHDVRGSVESLPDLSTSPAAPEALKATGTADPMPNMIAHGSELAHYLPIGETGTSRIVSEAAGLGSLACVLPGNDKPLPEKGLDASCRMEPDSVASASRWTRTINPLIKSQLLCQLS